MTKIREGRKGRLEVIAVIWVQVPHAFLHIERQHVLVCAGCAFPVLNINSDEVGDVRSNADTQECDAYAVSGDVLRSILRKEGKRSDYPADCIEQSISSHHQDALSCLLLPKPICHAVPTARL